MSANKLILDYVYGHETARANEVYLTQPDGAKPPVDYTWQKTMDEARKMATHLKGMGFEPGARIGILSKNCAHFFMAELAIWMAGYTTVAIFPTEGPDTVKYVLEHSGASLLFVGKLDTWSKQEPGVPADMPRIAFPLAPKTTYDTWDAITAKAKPIAGKPARKPDDLAMIIYTSGSTGQPKGVMHSFSHVSEATEGIVKSYETTLGAGSANRVLSYLPLAHVFERAYVECASFVNGQVHVYFAETLDTFLKDLQRATPTMFISVPRLWLKFQQGVFSKMPPAKLSRLLSIPILGKIVGKKVLKGLGLDQVKMAGSGSAPLPPELITWYRRLGLGLIEGYGMTEDFAYSYFSSVEQGAPGYVGVAREGVQGRISEQGEIQIKSIGRMVGYYKRPDLDAESFTDDGYFRTGDLGEINGQGLLRITGRLKELFKTGKGKYVAPAPIESMINSHPMVESVMVSGVGQSAAYGLVVLAEDLRPKMGDAAVRADVQTQLGQVLKEVNAKVADYEQLKMLVIAKEPWSIDNGCLTPTMKIKRNKIEANVESQVEGWYKGKGPVVWEA